MASKVYNDMLMAKKQATIKKVGEAILNAGDNGKTVKEIAIEFGVKSPTASDYISELFKQGLITCHREGKCKVWTWLTPRETAEEAEKAEQESFEIAEEIHPGGRIFEEIKPAHNVNQGDVVWCSSRSGDGQFFRYLVMVPWERKATVIGVIPEGHPCYNANDARYVPIGVDPETGEELFADISNTCSRGYAQFGEKLMKVSPENMSELKSVMSRYHRIPQKLVPVAKVDDDIWKKRFEDLSDQLKKAKAENLAISTQFSCQNKLLAEANDDLNKQLKAAYLECDEKKQACEEALKTAKNALDRVSVLEAENKEIREYNKTLGETNRKLKALEEEALKVSKNVLNDVPEPVISADQDALLWKISLLEQELKDKDEFITVLKQIVFKSLAKGGE